MSLELPKDAFSALQMTPEGFVKEVRLTAAVKGYEPRPLSQSKAAEIAGVTRHELREALRRFKVSPFQTSPEELAPVFERIGQAGLFVSAEALEALRGLPGESH